MGADVGAYKRIMGRFPSGVTIITMRAGDVEHGMTANSVTSVSMSPLLFLVCVKKTARAHDILARAGRFGVNFLANDQVEALTVFARDDLGDADRWPHVGVHRGRSGIPRIDGCVGYLECRLADAFDAGTHTIYLGDVEEAAVGEDKPPLVWFEAGAHDLAPSRS